MTHEKRVSSGAMDADDSLHNDFRKTRVLKRTSLTNRTDDANMKRPRKRLTKADLHRAEMYIERLRKRADQQGDSMTEWHLNTAGINVSDSIKHLGAGAGKQNP